MYLCGVVRVMNETEHVTNRTTYAELGTQIDSIRLARGYSRLEVAKGTKISNVRLNEIINGKYNPKIEVLSRIADFLDVPSDYLLIWIHQEFVLSAIDDYLYRIAPENLGSALLDLCVLFGASDDIRVMKYVISEFSEKKTTAIYASKKEKLQLFRKEAGYTQAQAAERVGVSVNHYAKFENGLTSFSLPVYLQMCQVFQKPLECIIDEERSGMILTQEQLMVLRQMKKENLLRLLETLRVFYEYSKQ